MSRDAPQGGGFLVLLRQLGTLFTLVVTIATDGGTVGLLLTIGDFEMA